jgi:hypothetical protein
LVVPNAHISKAQGKAKCTSKSVSTPCGFGYSQEEFLILKRSYMTGSEDLTIETNQKVVAFWMHVDIQYHKNIARANKNREIDPGWKVLQ